MNAPIRVRLTLWYVLVLAAVLTALGAFVVTRLRADLTAEADRTLTSAAAQMSQGYREEGISELRDLIRSLLPGPTGHSGVQILDAQATVVKFEGDPVLAAPLLDAGNVAIVLDGGRIVASRSPDDSDLHLRTVATATRRAGRREVLVVVESLSEVDRSVHRVLVLLLLGSLGALGFVAAGGWWIARRALKPVEQMTRRAERIGIGDLSERVPPPPVDDELGHLARTLNAMLGRIEDGVDARERLVADASHELRAPLAAMRVELDVSLLHDKLDSQARETLSSVREEIVSMGQIVENLLVLARSDEGHLELLLEDADLRDIVDAAARAHRVAAEAAGVVVTTGGDPVGHRVDRLRLQQVASNLIDNAIRFSPRGATVRVLTWHDNGEAGLTVSDDGPGVPAEVRERIFERFTRQDPARGRGGGAGLGLAISREIVQAHGGSIRVEDGEPTGSVFIVALPIGIATA